MKAKAPTLNVHLKKIIPDSQILYRLYAIKNKDDLENLNDLASLQSQVKSLRLQDKLGNKIFIRI